MAIDPTTTTTVKVSELASAGYNTTDLIPHEVAGILKKGNLQDLATFIGGIISTEGAVGFRAVTVTDGQTLPATTEEEFILVGPGTYPNVGGGSAVTTTEPLNALVSNGTYWFIGVEIPIGATGVWGTISGTLDDQTDLKDVLDLKADLVDGKVPSSQLPSYVDDVIEVANYAALPSTGETGKIYLTLDNNKIYRWSGSAYIEIADNNAVWGMITGTLSDQTDLNTALGLKVPYTGATGNVDLGAYKLTASDLVVNHTSGSGTAATISKGGNGEALTVTKSSGSGNVASFAGGVTSISELHLTTDLADDYIASAATWNAKQSALNGTGFVKISGTTISYDNTTYLSGTVAIANGGTGATTASAARTNLGATTIGSGLFTLPNAGLVSFLRVNADNTVELLGAELFRTSIGAGTGNGTVTSVEAVGGYGGLTLTGTVTGSGQLTLGGTPEGNWPINITGNASSVNTVQVSTNADFYLTFADANNGSPTSEFLYTIGSVKVNPSTGALTAGSFVKSGGLSTEYLMADGSVSTGSGGTVTGTGTTNYIPKFTGASAIGNSLIYDNGTNVGIGTTSPAVKFHSYGGALSVGDESSYSARFSNNSNKGVVIGYDSTNNKGHIGSINPAVAWTDLILNANGGNVGIGTTSPQKKLHVANGNDGAIQLGSSTYYGIIEHDATSTGANIYTTAAASGGGHIFKVGTSEYMRITSGGNVGIGTTSPLRKLTVTGSSGTTMIALENFGIDYYGIGMPSGSADMAFYSSASTERMRITSGGSVGIGTPSPSALLDINGTSTVQQNLSIANDRQFSLYSDGTRMIINSVKNVPLAIYTNDTERMRITSGGLVGIGTTSPNQLLSISSSAVGGSTFGLYNTASNTDNRNWALKLNANNYGDLGFFVSSSNGGNPESGSIPMLINKSGNVGIGTTSPSAKLEVVGGGIRFGNGTIIGELGYSSRAEIGTISNHNLGFTTNSITQMLITSGGNVGIGTTSPTYKLQVNGTAAAASNAEVLRLYNTLDGGLKINFANAVTNELAYITANVESAGAGTDDGVLTFGTAVNGTASERMRITSGGSVGIGTSSPAEKLEVQNGTSGAKIKVSNTGGGYAMLECSSNATSTATLSFTNSLALTGGNATFSNNVTATGFFNSSDNRLKDLTDYDYNVSDIKPITYLWKDGRDNKKHVGYSAQEVQKVMPDAVNEGTDGMLSVNYVEVLVAKIAELENRIKQLEK